MTNNNSLTWIDQLATETILEIFQYLSSNDIIYAFFDFNQRFNSILFHHQYYLQNFETPTTNFHFWQNVLSKIELHIQQLIITTIDFPFSLDLFPNLRSIVISSPFPFDYDQLCSISENKQFNKLISFKIQSKIYNQESRRNFLENIFHQKNSLQTFESVSKLNFTFHTNIKLLINNNISSLSLKLTSCNDIFSIFESVPNLKYFNLNLTSIDTYNAGFDLSKIKLEKLILTCTTDELKYSISGESFISLTNIIKQFSSSLNYLSINLTPGSFFDTYSFQFNGNFLQKQLLESMIQLQTFHFYAELGKSPNNVENFLLTFENQFWYDHNWSFGIHQKYLYTLPFHFNQLDGFNDFDQVKTNNLMILNSLSTWYRVTSIHFTRSYELNSNLIEQLKIKMPNLKSIKMSLLYERTNNLDNINTILDSVTTLHFIDTSSKPIQQWLTNTLPNVTYLIISGEFPSILIMNERITRLKILDGKYPGQYISTFDVYFPNLKHIEIESLDFMTNDIIKILKNLKNLKTLMLYYQTNRYPSMRSKTTDFCGTCDQLDLVEIQEKYQIKPGYECLQFVNKKQ